MKFFKNIISYIKTIGKRKNYTATLIVKNGKKKILFESIKFGRKEVPEKNAEMTHTYYKSQKMILVEKETTK